MFNVYEYMKYCQNKLIPIRDDIVQKASKTATNIINTPGYEHNVAYDGKHDINALVSRLVKGYMAEYAIKDYYGIPMDEIDNIACPHDFILADGVKVDIKHQAYWNGYCSWCVYSRTYKFQDADYLLCTNIKQDTASGNYFVEVIGTIDKKLLDSLPEIKAGEECHGKYPIQSVHKSVSYKDIKPFRKGNIVFDLMNTNVKLGKGNPSRMIEIIDKGANDTINMESMLPIIPDDLKQVIDAKDVDFHF